MQVYKLSQRSLSEQISWSANGFTSSLAFEIILKSHICWHKIRWLLCLLSHHKQIAPLDWKWAETTLSWRSHMPKQTDFWEEMVPVLKQLLQDISFKNPLNSAIGCFLIFNIMVNLYTGTDFLKKKTVSNKYRESWPGFEQHYICSMSALFCYLNVTWRSLKWKPHICIAHWKGFTV